MSFALLVIALVLFVLAGLNVASRFSLGWFGAACFVLSPMVGGPLLGGNWHGLDGFNGWHHAGGGSHVGLILLILLVLFFFSGGLWNRDNQYYPQHYGYFGGGGLIVLIVVLLLLGVL